MDYTNRSVNLSFLERKSWNEQSFRPTFETPMKRRVILEQIFRISFLHPNHHQRMSSKEERKVEDEVKSKHKKEKKEKKEKKRQRALQEEEESAATPTPISNDQDAVANLTTQSTDEPPSKKAKKESKEEKKKRKEEKKKAKAAASSSSAEATTSSAANPTSRAGIATDPAAARAFMEANNITLEAPEDSTERPPLPMLNFDELDGKVDDSIKKTIDGQGFDKPTPIQSCCWPVLLQGKDVVGVAETGSGKTFAFGVPALQHLMTDAAPPSKKKGKGGQGQISVLVVAPTRELAIQTQENLAKIGDPLGMGSICLYGGVSKYEQQSALRSSNPPIRIVVGTPGRVKDLASTEGSGLDLSKVSFLVLDEADRMLDKGFEPDIRFIIGLCKSREEGRKTSMFSATWPPAVRGLAETFMNNPVRVTVGSDELSANRRVEQIVEVLDDGRAKERKLDVFLKKVGAGPKGKNSKDKILIFALYKKEAARVEGNLRRLGYSVSAIHGDMGQNERMASLESFKTAETPLLVATDVAARGLDIPNVEYVVNYTFPLTIEDYVHRIGRTGRGGKTGKSLTYFTEEDKAHAGELVRVLRDADQPVPKEMDRFPTTIKKKTHSAYGDHFKELVPGKAKKITFD